MEWKKKVPPFLILVASLFLCVRCGDNSSSHSPSGPFEWVSGQNSILGLTVYGTLGVPNGANVPGARQGACTWLDQSNNLWLFGGYGVSSAGTTLGYLNDLWKFDGTNWTWMNGSNSLNSPGSYGTLGLPLAANTPAARSGASSWVDLSGNLWLFGGEGSAGNFNDVWKYNGVDWTWIAGPQGVTQPMGVYGVKGVAAPSNVPGARTNAAGWTDAEGNFWVFGGSGNTSSVTGTPADLWEFNVSNLLWTWVGGANASAQAGVYGTQGVAASANFPGSRFGAAYWVDSQDNFWLFGGNGDDVSGTTGYLDDLWKFDGTNWTWVAGTSHVNENSVYGTKGVATSSNLPAGRSFSLGFSDNSNNQWILGGQTATVRFADLWKFDGTHWTWTYGSNVADQKGTYGSKGVYSASAIPGARAGASGWVANGTFWLFGGFGVDFGSGYSYLNDLWHFNP